MNSLNGPGLTEAYDSGSVLNGTPDNFTLTKYGIISLFKHWWLHFFVNLVKKYSSALFRYHSFENRDAIMNLCPRLCVRRVVKLNSEILSSVAFIHLGMTAYFHYIYKDFILLWQLFLYW